MKTMIRFFCTMLVCAFFSGTLFAQEEKTGKELLGEWTYTFDHPMEGAVKGVCTFIEKDGKVTMTMGNGSETNSTSPLRWNTNGKYYADMDAQGYGITVSFKQDGDKMDCEMDAGVMVIPMAMEKKK